MEPSLIILIAWISFEWGQWSVRRKATATKEDVGMKLLSMMMGDILDKRKMVGLDTKIRRFETFEFQGQEYQLTLESKHDWEAV